MAGSRGRHSSYSLSWGLVLSHSHRTGPAYWIILLIAISLGKLCQ